MATVGAFLSKLFGTPIRWLAQLAISQALNLLVRLVLLWWQARVNKERADRLEKAIEELKRPNKSPQEAADAACKVEKVLNPDSDCDLNSGQSGL